MRKIHISSLDAWIIQRQLKQFREIKIWNILLRGHNFPVYCSMSGEGWRVLLLQTKERFYLLQPAWLSMIQSAYLYVETLQIFTANFLAKEWRLCTKALFYAISSRYRVQETHLRRLHWIVTIRAISNFWGKKQFRYFFFSDLLTGKFPGWVYTRWTLPKLLEVGCKAALQSRQYLTIQQNYPLSTL